MESVFIGKKPQYLTIGEFNILCSKNSDLHIDIPLSGRAFANLKPGFLDFQYIIEKVTILNMGKRVWGSNEFINPTFLYQEESGWLNWIKEEANTYNRISFRISPDWRQFILYEDTTQSKGEQAFREFGSLFSYAVLNHDACVLHGVVMEYEGKGILVTAPSGTGKTTHTRMWRDHKNALIINGDRCLCRKMGGRWYAYGMPWSGSSGEYINRKVPISCIVSLKRGDTNHAEPMSVFDGTIYLMQRIFAPVWQGDLQTKGFDLCEELASEIPMLEFFCRPELESVEVLERAVMQYGL